MATSKQRQNNTRSKNTAATAIMAALFLALARLALISAVAAWLVVLLLNEVAAALVYAIAAVLALFVLSG